MNQLDNFKALKDLAFKAHKEIRKDTPRGGAGGQGIRVCVCGYSNDFGETPATCKALEDIKNLINLSLLDQLDTNKHDYVSRTLRACRRVFN